MDVVFEIFTFVVCRDPKMWLRWGQWIHSVFPAFIVQTIGYHDRLCSPSCWILTISGFDFDHYLWNLWCWCHGWERFAQSLGCFIRSIIQSPFIFQWNLSIIIGRFYVNASWYWLIGMWGCRWRAIYSIALNDFAIRCYLYAVEFAYAEKMCRDFSF